MCAAEGVLIQYYVVETRICNGSWNDSLEYIHAYIHEMPEKATAGTEFQGKHVVSMGPYMKIRSIEKKNERKRL